MDLVDGVSLYIPIPSFVGLTFSFSFPLMSLSEIVRLCPSVTFEIWYKGYQSP